jgi:hypothetical protein
LNVSGSTTSNHPATCVMLCLFVNLLAVLCLVHNLWCVCWIQGICVGTVRWCTIWIYINIDWCWHFACPGLPFSWCTFFFLYTLCSERSPINVITVIIARYRCYFIPLFSSKHNHAIDDPVGKISIWSCFRTIRLCNKSSGCIAPSHPHFNKY